MKRIVCTPALALAIVVSVAGCELSGNGQDYPGASVFEAADEAFHFHYIAPPWARMPARDGAMAFFIVEIDSGLLGVSEVTHQLWVSYAPEGNPLAAALRRQQQLSAAKHVVTRPLGEIVSRTGEIGQEILTEKGEPAARNYFRDSFFADKNGRVIHFRLSAIDPTDHLDVDDLLRSFNAKAGNGENVPNKRPDGYGARDGGP